MTKPLYPFAQSATRSEIADRFNAASISVRYGARASGKQIEYLADLCIRNDASRAIYQKFVCDTSGLLPAKKAASMITKLLAI